MIETYLVGGAVRDELLGIPVNERDYVVVGSTEAQMLADGFRSVGKDFPVFLHPDTQEEYALARTERKSGKGHQGFICHASPDVTLEEDLGRRDLTINAIAKAADGSLVDPFSGIEDLEKRILRHVTDAFREDPLRILRVARFLAYLANFNFTVAPETNSLLIEMVNEGQVAELTPERVLMEANKALGSEQPGLFFRYLENIGADQFLWPELTEDSIEQLEKVDSRDPDIRFAAMLVHLDTDEINGLCQRLKCTNYRRELSVFIATKLDRWSRLDSMSAPDIVDFLYELDAMRKHERFHQFGTGADAIGQTALATRWRELADTIRGVKARDVAGNLTGPAVGDAVKAAQIEKVAAVLHG